MDAIDKFLKIVNDQPYAVAVSLGERTISYSDFGVLVRRLAAFFCSKKSPKILIALPQSIEAYACILAAGMSGGFYTPVNISSPVDKIKKICTQFRPDYIICDRALGDLLKYSDSFILNTDELDNLPSPMSGRGARNELAYVMFTSGSTGAPKGVIISREGLNHFVNWIGENYQITSVDRLSQHPNIAFDLSVFDIYGALCYGASLHPIVNNIDKLMPARFCKRESLTLWNSVPSVIGLMIQANQINFDNFSTLRLINFCGEPLLKIHLDSIFSARPDMLVYNTYGPTEATVFMTVLELNAGNYNKFCKNSVAIGHPIPGMQISFGNTNSTHGEIVITGPQLALGYWDAPELTNKSFRPVNVGGADVTGYFTGDWAEILDENYYFKERIDFQVKVNGYRIELDEIVAAINEAGWPVCCVLKYSNRLIGVVESTSNSIDILRDKLKLLLDKHMLPDLLYQVDLIPRNDNDKIDRRQVEMLVGDMFDK